MNKFI